jgi:hypothetical protein
MQQKNHQDTNFHNDHANNFIDNYIKAYPELSAVIFVGAVVWLAMQLIFLVWSLLTLTNIFLGVVAGALIFNFPEQAYAIWNNTVHAVINALCSLCTDPSLFWENLKKDCTAVSAYVQNNLFHAANKVETDGAVPPESTVHPVNQNNTL